MANTKSPPYSAERSTVRNGDAGSGHPASPGHGFIGVGFMQEKPAWLMRLLIRALGENFCTADFYSNRQSFVMVCGKRWRGRILIRKVRTWKNKPE